MAKPCYPHASWRHGSGQRDTRTVHHARVRHPSREASTWRRCRSGANRDRKLGRRRKRQPHGRGAHGACRKIAQQQHHPRDARRGRKAVFHKHDVSRDMLAMDLSWKGVRPRMPTLCTSAGRCPQRRPTSPWKPRMGDDIGIAEDRRRRRDAYPLRAHGHMARGDPGQRRSSDRPGCPHTDGWRRGFDLIDLSTARIPDRRTHAVVHTDACVRIGRGNAWN